MYADVWAQDLFGAIFLKGRHDDGPVTGQGVLTPGQFLDNEGQVSIRLVVHNDTAFVRRKAGQNLVVGDQHAGEPLLAIPFHIDLVT